MRWNSKHKLKPREGDERIVSKFLWYPRCFSGRHVRWLETADIIERVIKMDVGGSGEWGNYAWRWREVGFVHQMPLDVDGCLEIWNERIV